MDVVNGVEVPKVEQPAVKKMSREDHLEVENLYLKVTNMALQEQQLQQDLLKANKMRTDLQKEMEELRNKLTSKYQVDFASPNTQIKPDGTIEVTGPQFQLPTILKGGA